MAKAVEKTIMPKLEVIMETIVKTLDPPRSCPQASGQVSPSAAAAPAAATTVTPAAAASSPAEEHGEQQEDVAVAGQSLVRQVKPC